MKKIGLNLLYLNPKLMGGSFIYGINLVNNLAKIDRFNQYYIYINKDSVNLPFILEPNFKLKVIPFKYRNVYLRYFWEQFILPFYVLLDKIDLLHSLGYVGPIICPTKKIVSILDINYKGHGNNMNFLKRKFLGSIIYLTAKSSNYIITISEFSKQQILKYIGYDIGKIKVTLLSGFYDYKLNNSDVSVQSIYKISDRYIIAFSSPSSHKNIHRLIKAFKLVDKSIPDIRLVLVGYKTKGTTLQQLVMDLELETKVKFTGFVPDEHVDLLIAGAEVFVFPSLYEGFGIPILDAQASGVPIASSNAGSLPEVGGDAPVYFDPLNIEEMASAIIKILNNKAFASEIALKGKENRLKFSWRKTALETLEVYNKFIKQ